MPCKKTEIVCSQTEYKRVIAFGQTKTIKNSSKQVQKRKYVSYGTSKNIVCGKYTQILAGECCSRC